MNIIKVIKNEEGQSLVEFAIIVPIVLLIIMGILEFGMMFNSYLTITNASREGARLGAVGGSDSDIQTLITSISPNLDRNNLNINILPLESSRNRGDSITVSITYDYEVTVPIISNITNNFVELDAQTIMRVE